ncbi:MAG: GC-type dockerin domain-anchored protein [Phycisphaerales bacterium JB039]
MSGMPNISTWRLVCLACAVVAGVCSLLAGTASARAQCLDPSQIVYGSWGFAYDVVIDGDIMALARHEEHIDATLHIYERDGTTWREAASFLLGGSFHVPYRVSAAVSGDRVAAGTYALDRIWIFRREEGTWAMEQTIGFEPERSLAFGQDLAMCGDTLFVGEPARVHSSFDPGWAHVYQHGPDGWQLRTTLMSPNPDGRQFGRAIGFAGDVAAILGMRGSSQHDLVIFRNRDGEWSLEASIPIDLSRGSLYGRLVDVAGERIIVAANSAEEPALIYRFDGAAWTLEARLPGPYRYSHYPPLYYHNTTIRSVAIDGDRALAVGRIYDGDVGWTGVGYLFVNSGGAWNLERRVLRTAPTGWNFGEGADLQGPWAAISAPEGVVGDVSIYHLADPPAACPDPQPDPNNGLRLLSAGVLAPQTPEVAVRMQAFFVASARDTAFAQTRTSVQASEPGWGEPRITVAAVGGGDPGSPHDGRIEGIWVYQYSGFAGITAPPTNPVDLWEAPFRTDDFAPRVITMQTDTRVFDIYPWVAGHGAEFEARIAGIAESAARIRVWRSSCLADCDGSGALDVMDFVCFQELFSAGNLACDFDEDGMLTLFDFLAFQNEFAGGCP